MRKLIKLSIVLFFIIVNQSISLAATQIATVRVNSGVSFQKITGFGGFVCSPSFGYNWMTTDNIRKLWGKNSDAGYNIMRLYIPTAPATGSRESVWSQSLATAQLAKTLGIKIFASPWSMPAEWKSNSNIAAKYTDSNGVVQLGSLLEAYYTDYANYLNDYVTYMRNNGAELDAISIQNEPDMQATYAGCLWTPTQIANFVKNYGQLINCKVIAPESVGITDNYSAAFQDDNVCANFEIYAGHQYGNVQDGLKLVQAKGKEVWMTEFLINWNEAENTTRNFNWTKDAFNFADKVNSVLLNNVNAWIHYASRRYYGLMGDGTNGSTDGEITKRGYILSHYAKFATGATRIDNTWTDATNVLKGSSYLSVTGDSVIVMVINPSTDTYNLTVDLPFYTVLGKSIKTTEQLNMSASSISLGSETCRPKVTVDASSITTLIFTKSSVRPVSQMSGEAIHYGKVENQTVTNVAFGTNYQLSGKTVTFDHSNSLFSANTTASNGYLKLDDNYNQLVLHINTIKSAMNYTSSNTTLYYVNAAGLVNSHNYGTVNYNQSGNYDFILDISRSVLTDGYTGIIGISNGNYSSILTITFGDVYLRMANEKGYRFTGIYSKGDSNELDCLDDQSYTALDYTATTGVLSSQDWNAAAVNKNCVFYVGGNISNQNTNIVTGSVCNKLALSDLGGDFFIPTGFTSTSASYSCTISGYKLLVSPFESDIPSGAEAFTLQLSATEMNCNKLRPDSKIPANIPVLIKGSGTFAFNGSGNVSTPRALKVNDLNVVYVSQKAPVGSYSLKIDNGVASFSLVSSGSEPTINTLSAYLTPSNGISSASIPLKLNISTDVDYVRSGKNTTGNIFDIWGRQVYAPLKGVLYIRAGKKVLFY